MPRRNEPQKVGNPEFSAVNARCGGLVAVKLKVLQIPGFGRLIALKVLQIPAFGGVIALKMLVNSRISKDLGA